MSDKLEKLRDLYRHYDEKLHELAKVEPRDVYNPDVIREMVASYKKDLWDIQQEMNREIVRLERKREQSGRPEEHPPPRREPAERPREEPPRINIREHAEERQRREQEDRERQRDAGRERADRERDREEHNERERDREERERSR